MKTSPERRGAPRAEPVAPPDSPVGRNPEQTHGQRPWRESKGRSTKLQRDKTLAGFHQLVSVLKFSDDGLIPTIIQDAKSKQILTLCYLNREALRKSLNTGTVYLFRRSQQKLMRKGETSGHLQLIQSIAVDCEGKSLVFFVRQRVAACHAGYFTCYFRKLSSSGRLQVQDRKVFDPKKVYKGVTK